MNKKLFLSLGILALANSSSVFATDAENHSAGRSVLGAFEPKHIDLSPHTTPSSEKKSAAEEKLAHASLPTPPPVDTKALAFKPTLTPEEAQEDPFSSHEKSPFDTSSHEKTKDVQVITKNAGTNTQPALKETAEQKAEKAKFLKEEQEKDQLVRFYFEDASLENLVRYVEELYSIKFFIDDDLTPPPAGAGLLKGNKITFKTNKPMTRDEAWSLFLKFLDMAGLAVVESQITGFYRITTTTNANKEVLPTFFNTSSDVLPENSLKVRYIFFVKNSSLATIQTVVSQLASSTALVDTFPDLNAIIITDKAVNIRSLMKIVKELDKEMPEAMSVLQLKKADATDVANLYADLTKTESPQGMARFFGQRAQPDSLYFPANARIIVEPRTNSLILLGPAKSLAKIEEFITQHVDVELSMPYSPLYIYEVQYLNAANLASMLTTVVGFGQGSAAGAYGGIRNGDEYFGPVSITAETGGNRLIIKAEERDYKKLLPIIQQMDILQPEVAIEVLIVNISSTDNRALGSQIHNKVPNSPFKNVNMQTSGFPTSGGASGPIISNSGSLLGNLISLAGGGTTGDGSTYMTIGDPVNGVWGIFKALKAFSETSVIANPFLLSTNNYAAQVSVGTTRQVQTGSVVSTQGPTASYSTLPANLTVQITPQISLNSSVQMVISVNLTDFSDPNNNASGNTFTKAVSTSVSVKNREIVVLGGMVKNQVIDVESKVPILGDIPLVGWLFKNKQKTTVRENILIFISPRILTVKQEEDVDYYTINKAEEAKDLAKEMIVPSAKRDPINKAFFGPDRQVQEISEFLEHDPMLKETQATMDENKAKSFKKKNRKTKKTTSSSTEKTTATSPKEPRRGRFTQKENQE